MAACSPRRLVLACFWGAALGVVMLASRPALAISPNDYQRVGVTLPVGATVPGDVTVKPTSGQPEALRSLIDRPTVLVLADYRCRTLCGPVIDFVTTALEQSGLKPADQFRAIVVTLDARDTEVDARAMKVAHLHEASDLDGAISFFTIDQTSLDRLTSALGYRYIYDAAADQFVHPAAAFILRANGRVSRVLTGVGLSGADMRLALVEAGNGKIGTVSDRVRLLCSAFDPVQGIYTPLIGRVLAAASATTIIVVACGMCLLAVSNRRSA